VSSDAEADAGDRSSLWALPLLALGLGLVACGVLIPEAEENRRLADEHRLLLAEVEALDRQAALNEDFLSRLHGDADLVRRLVRRQTPVTEPAADSDVAFVPLSESTGRFERSPFALLAAERVVAPPPTRPSGGLLADLCRHPRMRLVTLGTGLLCCLVGLLSGGSAGRTLKP
jgi:hypothetical protein